MFIRGSVFIVMVVCFLCSCSSPPWVRPDSVPALAGLIDESQLSRTRSNLSLTRDKVLAIVYSKNVDYSRALNDKMRRQVLGWIAQFNTADIGDDVNLVYSDEVLMSGLLTPVRAAFREVRFVRDIPEGFEGGADYVGVLDVDLNTTISGVLAQTQTNVANASLLFIDQTLVAGPQIQARVTHEETLVAKGADGNIRDTVRLAKDARAEMISGFAADFSTKVAR